jgi:hypothetical protein
MRSRGRLWIAAVCALSCAISASACRRQRIKDEQSAGRGASVLWRAQVLAGAAAPVPQPEPAPAPAQPTPAPDAALNCFVMARYTLLLADQTAAFLCAGAITTAPAECFQAGRHRTGLLDDQLTALCRCSTSSTAPIDCYKRGNDSTFLIDQQLILLCNATSTQQLRPNCAPWG